MVLYGTYIPFTKQNAKNDLNLGTNPSSRGYAKSEMQLRESECAATLELTYQMQDGAWLRHGTANEKVSFLPG